MTMNIYQQFSMIFLIDFPMKSRLVDSGGGWYGQPGDLAEALGAPLRSQPAPAGLRDHPLTLRGGVESRKPQTRGDRAEFVEGQSQSQRGVQANWCGEPWGFPWRSYPADGME